MNQDYLLRPPELTSDEERYLEMLNEHHECCLCSETVHESKMHRTTWGYACIDCYDYCLANSLKDGSEMPEIINS